MSKENKTKFENSEERLKRFGEKLRQQDWKSQESVSYCQRTQELKSFSKQEEMKKKENAKRQKAYAFSNSSISF